MAHADPNVALKLAREIFELEAQLAMKQSEWCKLFGQEPPTASQRSGAAPPSHTIGQTREDSVATRIRRVLETNPGRTLHIAALCAAVPGVDARRIRSEAARLARTKRTEGFRNVARGAYRYRPPAAANGAAARGGA